MDNRERALSMLSTGLRQDQVAAAIGITESQISQYIAEPEFATSLLENRLIEHTRSKNIDNKWDELEELLLKKFEDLIPLFYKPKDVLEALVRINAAKRKLGLSSGAITNSDANRQVVNINLPAITIQNYKINVGGQMTEVAGRKLQSMSSQLLMKTLEERRSNVKEPTLLEGVSRKSSDPREISADSV